MSAGTMTLDVPRSVRDGVMDVDPALVAPPPDAVPVAQRVTTGLTVCHNEAFDMRTRGVAPSFYDVTDLVADVVSRSGVLDGSVLASMAHTTCALIVQENEPLLLADLADRLRRFASEAETYRHNELHIRVVNVCADECANGHSHCQHALLGSSATLPVHAGNLVLGRWQRLLAVELDHPRTRRVMVQVIGVAASDRT